jgi:predicted ATPase
VERELVSDDERDQWPFTIPCVAAIARDGLELRRPVTFLVGENGSGKSTLVEAIAEAAGLDSRGGRAGRKYGNQRQKTRLGEVMRLGLTREGAKMRLRARTKRKGYFLRAETLFGLAEVVSGLRSSAPPTPRSWPRPRRRTSSRSATSASAGWRGPTSPSPTTGAATSPTRPPTCAT